MNITEYLYDYSKPYHFESSDNFCDIIKIEKARSIVLQKLTLRKTDILQLNAIVELEILRYKFASNKIELAEYKETIKRIDVDFFRENNYDIFENTAVHENFYDYLNREYK